MDETSMLHDLSIAMRTDDYTRDLEFSPIYNTFQTKRSIFDNVLTDEDKQNDESAIDVETTKLVFGADLNEAPVKYKVEGIKPHELPVIGMYVAKQICPGFRYKVRYTGRNDELFDGKSRVLLSVGIGYGKRLTFSGDRLNNNDNYFWSDSDPSGFAFSLQAVCVGDKFVIYNAQSEYVGRVTVTSLQGHQKETGHELTDGYVSKTVRVVMTCIVEYYHLHSSSVETIRGEAIVRKESRNKLAKIDCIRNVNFSHSGQCTLRVD